MRFQGICFDMDGVIIDSEPSHYEAFRQTFESHDGSDLSHADYQYYFAGKTTERGFIDYFADHHQKYDLSELLKQRASHYRDIISTSAVPYPDTISTIQQLNGEIPLALVTSAVTKEVDFVLRRFNLIDCFSVVICADDISSSKPDPEGYLLAAERLGVMPNTCAVIEDAPSGILAAKRAGMFCVALTNTHDPSLLNDADRIINRLSTDAFNDDTPAHSRRSKE